MYRRYQNRATRSELICFMARNLPAMPVQTQGFWHLTLSLTFSAALFGPCERSNYVGIAGHVLADQGDVIDLPLDRTGT
jgi:hypothetical protein